MTKNTRFVGLDVHAKSISVAVAELDGTERFVGKIPNQIESIRKLMKKLGPKEDLRVCYEAGPCGYVLYWQLTKMGVACEVIAPTLIPVKSGDRVKTDRKDSLKLARCHRSGDLTPVWVPDAEHEAVRCHHPVRSHHGGAWTRGQVGTRSVSPPLQRRQRWAKRQSRQSLAIGCMFRIML